MDYAIRKEFENKGKLIRKIQELVIAAQSYDDYFDHLGPIKVYEKAGFRANLECHHGCPDYLSDWVFNLTMKNMEDIYNRSWKWDENAKRSEIMSENAIYIFAFDEEANPIGFLHFRFEQIDYEFVIYIYDVQVEKEYEKIALNRYLIQVVHIIGMNFKVEACLAFLFKEDHDFAELLDSLQYTHNRNSPSMYAPSLSSDYCYEIMSKSITKKD